MISKGTYLKPFIAQNSCLATFLLLFSAVKRLREKVRKEFRREGAFLLFSSPARYKKEKKETHILFKIKLFLDLSTRLAL